MAPGKPKTKREVVFWGRANQSSQGNKVATESLNGMLRSFMTSDESPYGHTAPHGGKPVVGH
jgi:hypothetical protein